MADTRKDKRAPVSLKVRFKSATVDQFIEQYSMDISRGGLFIKSKSPMPVGTLLKFEFQLKDESRLIQGVGRVVWMRMAEQSSEPDRPPGMGVKFIKMDPQSRAIVERIVAPRGERPAAYESGTADAAPPPPRPGPSYQPYAAVRERSNEPFFPSTTPEDELPPLEDRTQVRHASQFLASAVAQAGMDPQLAEEAEQEAWRARRRTGELERQRAVAASLGDSRTDSVRPTQRPPDGPHRSGGQTVAYEEEYGGLFGSGAPESSQGVAIEEPPTGVFDPPARVSAGPPERGAVSQPSFAPRSGGYVASTKLAKPTSNWRPALTIVTLAAMAMAGLWMWQDKAMNSLSMSAPEPTAAGRQSEVTQRSSQVKENQPASSTPAPSQEVSVQIRSEPSAATVTVDGVEKGRTPLTLQLPKDGLTVLSARASGFGTITKQVRPGSLQGPVDLKLPPLVYVLEVFTSPVGAEVTALGQSKRSPAILSLGPIKNNFIVRAQKPGFVAAERVIMLDDFAERGSQMRHRMTLELRAKPQQVQPTPKPEPTPAPPSTEEPIAPAPTPEPVPGPVVPTPTPTPAPSPPAPAPTPKPPVTEELPTTPFE